MRHRIITLLLTCCVACSFEPPSTGWLDPIAADDGRAPETGLDPTSRDVQIADRTDGAAALDQGNDLDTRADLAPLDQGPDRADMDPTDLSVEDARPDLGTAECNGEQVDLRVSSIHCGACNNPCDPVFGYCSRGRCVCSPPNAPCGPSALCVNIETEPRHCGGCGIVCSTGEVCIAGQCECGPRLTRCGGTCVDVETNPQHCGVCGVSCLGDACSNGKCRSSCDFFERSCSVTGGEACISDDDQLLHCGSGISDPCGTACTGEEVCVYGGVLSGWRCQSYRAARGCQSCPCPDCRSSQCEELYGAIYCIN